MGYHLNQKERFSLKSGKSQISMKLLENIKFFSGMHSRLVFLLEKLQIFMKIMKLVKTLKLLNFPVETYPVQWYLLKKYRF